ncbi:stage III sporulation protein AC [Metallumcola ferriviriculae]|uniref:Stage III sporulation protein AC n=1 Tax=Metallumcola ferriviriculae TaxID=3039180 RepID=A0AAU0URC1_9FIRM|nr:stage III sporulation protein AC [Desulfitibacteraceae bacterium MK1]
MADVNLIFQLAALGIVMSILFKYLKQSERDEIAYLTLLAGLAVAVLWVLPVIADLFREVKSVFQLY